MQLRPGDAKDALLYQAKQERKRQVVRSGRKVSAKGHNWQWPTGQSITQASALDRFHWRFEAVTQTDGPQHDTKPSGSGRARELKFASQAEHLGPEFQGKAVGVKKHEQTETNKQRPSLSNTQKQRWIFLSKYWLEEEQPACFKWSKWPLEGILWSVWNQGSSVFWQASWDTRYKEK